MSLSLEEESSFLPDVSNGGPIQAGTLSPLCYCQTGVAMALQGHLFNLSQGSCSCQEEAVYTGGQRQPRRCRMCQPTSQPASLDPAQLRKTDHKQAVNRGQGSLGRPR